MKYMTYKSLVATILFIVLCFSPHLVQAQIDGQLKTLPDGSIEQFDGSTKQWDVHWMLDGSSETLIGNQWIRSPSSKTSGRPMPNGTVEFTNDDNVKERITANGDLERLNKKTLLGFSYDTWELYQTRQQFIQKINETVKEIEQQAQQKNLFKKAISECVPIVRRESSKGYYVSEFDAYATDDGMAHYLGNKEEQFEFQKCMAEKGQELK